MKRTLAALVVVVLVSAGNAQAGTEVRRYQGATSEGTAIGFKILRATDREFGLRSISFDYALTCPSGRTLRPDQLAVVYGDPLGYPMDGHHLHYLFFDGWPDVVLHGVFRARSASGTITLSATRFTKDGHAVQCTSGPSDWVAQRG